MIITNAYVLLQLLLILSHLILPLVFICVIHNKHSYKTVPFFFKHGSVFLSHILLYRRHSSLLGVAIIPVAAYR